ncbi:ABC transporter permease [Enterocloster bolteae]|uniref:ABC transporter permease n=1 Tax=Enterocloster bolteae TaxID=208479 RepID=UPI002A80709F|nr:ABC transporter permease [Enterocloster bolteae]
MKDILFGNNNASVIKRLSNRYFKAGKSRNVIAGVAIALTTLLFTAIFTLGSGLMDTVQDQNIRRQGGDGQAVLNYISDQIYEDVKDHPLIDKIAYTKAVSYRLQYPGMEKWPSDLWYMDDMALEFARYTPTTGRRPQTDNEIIADTRTLETLGVPAEVGQTVTLQYDIKGTQYTTDFTLCGFWETDMLSGIGRLIVSKAFVDAHSELLTYTYPEDNDYSGIVAAYVMFRGGGAVEPKLQKLISETGYTCDIMGGSPSDSNYVIARISPAYQGGELLGNPALLLSGLAGILLIMVTGYLIIYNIFQISVIQDIQSYGQLKTLGTTSRQIKRLIARQSLRLSAIGIPIGLLAGFLIGKALMPFLMNGTVYSAEAGVKVSANPFIFLGAAAFAFLTVWLSVRKPAKIAGFVSPIEAVRCTESDVGAFRRKGEASKKSTGGAKIYRMALSNLGRNRKRTLLVILSMTLSLVLFHTVFTLSRGFDIEKYVAKFVNKDFVISTADYFNYKFETSKMELTTSFVEAVRQHEAYLDGGGLYSTRTLEEAFSAESGAVSSYNKDEKGNPYVQFFGADDFLLESMEAVEGSIDWETMKRGGYVLYGLACDDKGNVIDNPAIQPGDTLRFHHVTKDGLNRILDSTFDLTVMAKVRINENTDTTRNTGEARFYLPTEQFLPLCRNPHMVSYPFNVKDGAEADMEAFLSSYVEDVEPRMNYDSKETYIRSFHDLTSLIVTIGGALSMIIGFIGIANFVNSVLTSIITRRKEFAMLQSIGMTGKQLKWMLTWEGVYYAAGTIIASAVIGTLFSAIAIQTIAAGIWFFTYRFIFWPMLVVYPFLILLTMIIPVLLYRGIARDSIIERLRQG